MKIIGKRKNESQKRFNTTSQKTSQNAQDIRKFEKHLTRVISRYHIARVTLNSNTELEKVCETFTKINTKGVKLDIFDLMNAYLRPKDLELKKMWLRAKPQLEFIKTDKTKIFVLQAMSVSLQDYFSQMHLYNLIPDRKPNIRQDPLVEGKEHFEQLWVEAIEKLRNAIKLLSNPREYGITSSKYIPYTSILPVFAVVNADAEKLTPERRLSAKRKIKQWYWVGAFTRRYQSQADSTNAGDYRDLKKWFEDDAAEPTWRTEPLGRIELREAKPTGSIYKGVFNLLIVKGACDWITGEHPLEDQILDDHHIIPKSWGEAPKLTTSIDTILNKTPLSAKTNREVIRDRLPNQYLPELIKKYGKNEVLKILESHLISDDALDILMEDPFTPAHYEAFIEEREQMLLDEIKRKCRDECAGTAT